jgi:hypothetical protein
VKWKLHTQDEGHCPHLVAWSDHDTKEAALDRACATRSQLLVKILFIEGPHGERIEPREIEASCKARRQ